MQELKKIGVLATAKLFAVIGVVVGLAMGILIAILTKVNPAAIETMVVAFPGYSYFTGYVAIITMPLSGAVKNFIVGAIGAWLYNLVAGWIGGIPVELGKEKKK